MRGLGITAVIVAVETIEVSLSTIMKAAMTRGMSQFIFMLYFSAVGLFILLPSSFLFYRKRSRPQITLSVVSKLFLLSFINVCIGVFFNTGIKYSSPALCSAIADLTPAFTFLLALISGTEKVELRLASSQAKAMGTIVSVAGALLVTLYKGQPITIFPSQSGSESILQSFQSNWVLGGFLCSLGALCLSLFFIVQGIFAVSLRSVVHTWAVRKKGPLYTSIFKPIGMIIATLMGVTFLGDVLHIGSVIGGIIIAAGFFSVIWGKR